MVREFAQSDKLVEIDVKDDENRGLSKDVLYPIVCDLNTRLRPITSLSYRTTRLSSSALSYFPPSPLSPLEADVEATGCVQGSWLVTGLAMYTSCLCTHTPG